MKPSIRVLSVGLQQCLDTAYIGNFIEALPPTTQIAVGYMQNGRADIAQSFTNNHESAASALWAPMSVLLGVSTAPKILIFLCIGGL
jgi:hypothetical protein